MAYTIPEYVDTQEQAILAVASAVKGEQVTGGDGSVNTALDILADALAGEDVEVPMTQQGAILALAQYVGGGGGGVDVGALVQVMYRSSVEIEPAVGDAVNLTPIYDTAIIKIGEATIADVTTTGSGIHSDVGWASGATLTTIWMPAFSDSAANAAYAFTYTVETVEEVDYYKTVTILQDAVTMETMTDEWGDVNKRYTFTVPAVDEGTYFAVAYVGNWE
ncbi:MAG: hypothetical protein IJH08_06035 [Atopobiaceae bacterium]|nr:hypothetical protein [Atopobiaceae bacterium]